MDTPKQKRIEKEGNKMTVELPHEKFKILYHNVQGFINKQLEFSVLLNSNLKTWMLYVLRNSPQCSSSSSKQAADMASGTTRHRALNSPTRQPTSLPGTSLQSTLCAANSLRTISHSEILYS